MKLLFLPGSRRGPASRFRVWQFVEPLRNLGHQVTVRVTYPEHYWRTSLKTRGVRYLHAKVGRYLRICSGLHCVRDAGSYDLVFMNRAIVPEAGVRFVEPWLAKKNRNIIFDFDDAIHRVGDNESKLRFILPHFACVTAGNEYLASFAREVNDRVEVWPTVVDTQKYRAATVRKPGPVRVGWSGSRDTLKYCFPLLTPIIRELGKTERFEFVVIADVPPIDSGDGLNPTFLPWTAEKEVEGLQQIDIGLMPLEDKPFERGKCGLKAIQYMGCGTPALVSPVGVNEQIVKHGETGFHCRAVDDWVGYLRQLIRNPGMRLQIGRLARERVETYYSVSSLLPRMVSLFHDVSASRQGQAVLPPKGETVATQAAVSVCGNGRRG